MARVLSFLTLLAITSLSTAEDLGWSAGLGVISSDVIGEPSDSFFPTLQSDDKQFMFIPSVKYQWEQWSLGVDGVGWKTNNAEGLNTDIRVGFPASSISVNGQRGWFRYGASSSLTIPNGPVTENSVTAGPVTYSAALGLDSRAGDWQQQVSFGAPVFLSSKLGVTVIGSAYGQWENGSYIENDLKLNESLTDDTYFSPGLSLFSVWQASDNLTVLLRGGAQWNDDALTNQQPDVPDFQANIFLLLNYYFGR